jgi:hypothetical protein
LFKVASKSLKKHIPLCLASIAKEIKYIVFLVEYLSDELLLKILFQLHLEQTN